MVKSPNHLKGITDLPWIDTLNEHEVTVHGVHDFKIKIIFNYLKLDFQRLLKQI